MVCASHDTMKQTLPCWARFYRKIALMQELIFSKQHFLCATIDTQFAVAVLMLRSNTEFTVVVLSLRYFGYSVRCHL